MHSYTIKTNNGSIVVVQPRLCLVIVLSGPGYNRTIFHIHRVRDTTSKLRLLLINAKKVDDNF